LSPTSESNRVLGLRGLLLRYFDLESADEPDVDVLPDDSDSDEDQVDCPEVPAEPNASDRAHLGRALRPDATEGERKRVKHTAKRIADTLLSEEFLLRRPQSMLATDISVAALLMISGYAEGWLSAETFFDLSHQIWTGLFFDHDIPSDAAGVPCGWIEYLLSTHPVPSDFKREVGTDSLTAALAAWVFACPHDGPGFERARFVLATRMAVARHPWLWNLDHRAEVAQELYHITSRTRWLALEAEPNWRTISSAWDDLVGEGLALRSVEQVLGQRSLQDWRASVKADHAANGAVTWQGKTRGFCVVASDTRSVPLCGSGIVPVVSLRSGRSRSEVKASFLLPVSLVLQSLVEDRAVPEVTGDCIVVFERFLRRIETTICSPSR